MRIRYYLLERRKSDRTSRQNHPFSSFSLGVGPSKPQSQSQPSNPESKQLVPLCIATKSSRKSGKRRKSDRTGRQNRPLTSFLLGVDPSKPPREPSQSSAPKLLETSRIAVHLPIAPNLPSSDPPSKIMRAEQMGDQKRLTLMGEMHPPCRSVRCASRIIPPRHCVIWTL